METRVLKVLTDEDIQKVQETVSSWRNGEGYEDIKGFCKSSTTEDIKSHNYILTPGTYVGIKDEDSDGVPFEKKMKLLSSSLKELTDRSNVLDKEIKNNLSKIGYEI